MLTSLTMLRLTLCVLVLCLPFSVQANIFDAYGFGARASAMGNAQVAASRDYSAVHYNPGALTYRKIPHVGTGIQIIQPDLYLDRDYLPEEGSPPDRLPEGNAGIHLGLLFPLGGLIENRFALGIGAYFPAVNMTRVEAPDPQTPHFYRHQALSDRMAIAFGIAYELHPMLSLGLGYQYLESLNGEAEMELDLFTQRFIRKNLTVDIEIKSALITGLELRPTENLRFGFSFRDALALDYRIYNEIKIRDMGNITTEMEGNSVYTPQRYTLGGAWEGKEWTATADLVWSRWSEAPSPSTHFVMLVEGEPLNLESMTAEGDPSPLGAVDTLSPRLGLEHRLGDWTLRGGYALYPSPLPSQSSYSNYADNDTHQFALGGGYSFPDPLAIREAPITLDLTIQFSWLPERRMEKEDPDDAVGSYSVGGKIWNSCLTIRHDFH